MSYPTPIEQPCKFCGSRLFRNYFEGEYHYSTKDANGYFDWWNCTSSDRMHSPESSVKEALR